MVNVSDLHVFLVQTAQPSTLKNSFSNTATLAPKVCGNYGYHVCLAHIHADHKESIVRYVFRCVTATNKDLGKISRLTLIRSVSAQQKRVCLHHLDTSYTKFSVDKSSPASNTSPSSSNASSSNASSSTSQISSVIPNARNPESQQPSSSSKVVNLATPQSEPIPSSQPCVLLSLREKVEKLPRTVPIAKKTHILAGYSQSPQKLTSDIENDADVWETWDRKLNVFLQCNDDELKQLVVRGKFGLIGLVGLFEHLVRDRKVDEGLTEGKVKRLVDAIDAYVPFFSLL